MHIQKKYNFCYAKTLYTIWTHQQWYEIPLNCMESSRFLTASFLTDQNCIRKTILHFTKRKNSSNDITFTLSLFSYTTIIISSTSWVRLRQMLLQSFSLKKLYCKQISCAGLATIYQIAVYRNICIHKTPSLSV